ncbi:MAG: hypothetical protein HC913_01705 [Microscillaceae bacterium]|nr:hypothetical protein [Microscillaceae bacterium]
MMKQTLLILALLALSGLVAQAQEHSIGKAPVVKSAPGQSSAEKQVLMEKQKQAEAEKRAQFEKQGNLSPQNKGQVRETHLQDLQRQQNPQGPQPKTSRGPGLSPEQRARQAADEYIRQVKAANSEKWNMLTPAQQAEFEEKVYQRLLEREKAQP